jgi:hypothetical protein
MQFFLKNNKYTKIKKDYTLLGPIGRGAGSHVMKLESRKTKK